MNADKKYATSCCLEENSMMVVEGFLREKKANEGHKIIAIDGRKQDGKSTLSRYLSYRLRMPCITGDVFQFKGDGGWVHRYDDIARIIKTCKENGWPVIIECIKVMEILDAVKCVPDYRVFIKDSANNYDEGRQEETYGTYNSNYSVNGESIKRLHYSYLDNDEPPTLHEIEVNIECK